MMTNKAKILVLAVSAALLAAAAYFYIEKAAIYIFAKTNGLEIRYGSVKRGAQGEYRFRDFSIAESKSGIGLRSGEAGIKLLPAGAPSGGISLGFDMKDVNFIKAAPSEGSYGDVEGLVSGAFSKNVKYGELRGTVTRCGDVITVSDLDASGDLMRVSLSGRISRSGDIFADCVIYFSDEVKRRIPKEVSDIILKESPAGWPSLSVHIEGNYKAPAISVSGRHFKLNIREVVQR